MTCASDDCAPRATDTAERPWLHRNPVMPNSINTTAVTPPKNRIRAASASAAFKT
jgi:hypothetical protein